jgi:hypothetical protein
MFYNLIFTDRSVFSVFVGVRDSVWLGINFVMVIVELLGNKILILCFWLPRYKLVIRNLTSKKFDFKQ